MSALEYINGLLIGVLHAKIIRNGDTHDGYMKIHLDLSNYCIETALKKFYERSISGYIKGSLQKDNPQLAQTIELTKYALEQLDFDCPRSRCRPLSGGTDYAVMLSISEKRLTIWVDDRIIETCNICSTSDRGS